MNEDKIERGKKIIHELAQILGQLSDEEVGRLLGNGAMHEFMLSILDPAKVKEYPNIAEFLLANKTRSTLLALIRHAITQNYSIKGKNKEGMEGYVSPHFTQWFEDGVMFLEGKERFSGVIGLYRNKEVRYAIAARDARLGEQLGPDFFQFISMDDFKAIPPKVLSDLEKPIQELQDLLHKKNDDEAKYQEFFEKYPWILGAQYEKVQRHKHFDDKNIPDFTCVRVHDKYRDIIEIKQPFMTIFRKDGEFSSEFNDAWNQVERYLNFAREEKDYLRHKGLNFDNPKCYLIVGFKLSDEEISKMRTKGRLNPAIGILTYDDLLVLTKTTVDFVKNLRDKN